MKKSKSSHSKNNFMRRLVYTSDCYGIKIKDIETPVHTRINKFIYFIMAKLCLGTCQLRFQVSTHDIF